MENPKILTSNVAEQLNNSIDKKQKLKMAVQFGIPREKPMMNMIKVSKLKRILPRF